MKSLRLLGSFTSSIKCDCDKGQENSALMSKNFTVTSELESARTNFKKSFHRNPFSFPIGENIEYQHTKELLAAA